MEGRYVPRKQFIDYHNRSERWAKIVAHRRCGKTVACVNDLIAKAMFNQRADPPPRYSYIGPSFDQVKDIAWPYMLRYGGPLVVNKNEGMLFIELPNKARITLYGAQHADRLRGLYNDGVVVDEPADLAPSAWPLVISPTLADYSGWATFIGTPRGHDWFFNVDRDEEGQPQDGWFRLVLKASDTHILAQEELDAQRKIKTPEQYAQEFECSFDAAIHGAYFAKGLRELKEKKPPRFIKLSIDPILAIKCYFDIGAAGDTADATAIWVVQFRDEEILVQDYIEGQSQPIGYYAELLRRRGYDRAQLIFPHDGLRKDHVGKTVADHWRDAGWGNSRSIPNQGRGASLARVEAVRRLLSQCYFDDLATRAGVEALTHYHEKWDEDRRMGLGPLHDWSSHAADAFGLMAIDYKNPGQTIFSRPYKPPPMGIV